MNTNEYPHEAYTVLDTKSDKDTHLLQLDSTKYKGTTFSFGSINFSEDVDDGEKYAKLSFELTVHTAIVNEASADTAEIECSDEMQEIAGNILVAMIVEQTEKSKTE